MKDISLFSDGSSLGNPGYGGYCAILRYKENEKIISGSENDTTDNRMELQAVISGIEGLKESCNIKIYSDSSYVVNAINIWLLNWVKKSFKNVKNIDLWKKYLEVSKQHNIEAIWVKGHNGHIENERCDKIAREEAEKLKKGIK